MAVACGGYAFFCFSQGDSHAWKFEYRAQKSVAAPSRHALDFAAWLRFSSHEKRSRGGRFLDPASCDGPFSGATRDMTARSISPCERLACSAIRPVRRASRMRAIASTSERRLKRFGQGIARANAVGRSRRTRLRRTGFARCWRGLIPATANVSRTAICVPWDCHLFAYGGFFAASSA